MIKILKVMVGLLIVFNVHLMAKVVITSGIAKPIGEKDKDFDDSEFQFLLAIQPYLSDKIALDFRLDSSNSNHMGDGGKSDLERMGLNMLYDFRPTQTISPYIYAGSGYEKIHRTYKDIKSQPFLNVGVGMRANITDDIDIRSEVKYIKMSDTKDRDTIASIGFGVKFGSERSELIYDKKSEVNIPSTTANRVKNTLTKDYIVFDDEIVISSSDVKNRSQKKIERNYIQVAVLNNNKNLQNILKKLKNRKFKTKSINRGRATVVLVGPYSESKIRNIYKRVKTIQKDAFYRKL
jgi:fructose-specific phosphotransferase system component IIB